MHNNCSFHIIFSFDKCSIVKKYHKIFKIIQLISLRTYKILRKQRIKIVYFTPPASEMNDKLYLKRQSQELQHYSLHNSDNRENRSTFTCTYSRHFERNGHLKLPENQIKLFSLHHLSLFIPKIQLLWLVEGDSAMRTFVSTVCVSVQ